MMPKMMMAAKIEVAQLVKATMHASLNDHSDYSDLIQIATNTLKNIFVCLFVFHLIQLFVTGLYELYAIRLPKERPREKKI